MEMQEQENAEETRRAPVPLGTKIGLIALPLLPTIVIDVITHGGLTPPALTAFCLSYLAFDQSPKVLAKLGESKGVLEYLSTHPEMLRKVDKITSGYMSKQIATQRIPIAQPHEDQSCATKQAEPLPVTQGDEPMEARQPKCLDDVLDFASDDELARPVLAPTGPLYFSDVLKTFTPTLDKIYLATLPNGEHKFIQARNLCHTAITGSTRGGKSQILRQLASQLCYAGAKVYLLNPHYIRYDLEAVDPYNRSCPEDWTPFEAYFKNDPREMIPLDTKYQVIEHYLRVAYDLVGKRLEIAGRSEQRLGAPHFIIIDELPAIIDEVAGAAQYLKRILREGAKVGVFVVNASQDLQVGTVFQGVGGGIRKCYRTAFDVGSDPATQRALGLPVLEGLGKGNASFRCDDEASSGRVPYVDNKALYTLLGPSTYVASKRRSRHDEEDEIVAYTMGASSEERETDALPVQRQHVHMSGYDQHRQRLASRKVPVYVAAREQASRQTAQVARVPETPAMEEGHDEDLERGIRIYRGGAKTLDAFTVAMGFAKPNQARGLWTRVKMNSTHTKSERVL